MKNLEDLTVNENATYFVEILTNDRIRNDSLCSIESFLKKTTSPVFLVLILVNSSQENLTSVEDLERAHTNFVTITFDMNTFFNRTLFANFQSNDPKFLTFLAKILVSWNVGGTVLDTKLKYLKDRNTIFPADEKDVSLGTYENDVVLISVKRFCHAYIFDILKTIAETRDIVKYNQVEIIENAKKRFCRGKWNCRGVKFVPSSTFCTVRKKNDNCAFLVSKPSKEMNTTQVNSEWQQFCPIVRSLLWKIRTRKDGLNSRRYEVQKSKLTCWWSWQCGYHWPELLPRYFTLLSIRASRIPTHGWWTGR